MPLPGRLSPWVSDEGSETRGEVFVCVYILGYQPLGL